MQQFDLSLWPQDKSRKIVTRDGSPVRIVCYDMKSVSPIIGVILHRLGGEFERNYDTNGRFSPQNESEYDLFFADEEEELTEFEEAIYQIAKELIDLARKELEEKYRIINKDDSDLEDGYKQGKQDALKTFQSGRK